MFRISGAPIAAIPDIPTILPGLDSLMKTQWIAWRPGYSSIPRMITFTDTEQTPQPRYAVTGSARALDNLFNDVIKQNTSDIHTLIINNKDRFYHYDPLFSFSLFFSSMQGGLERLPDTFSKIEPNHFPLLTVLQILLAQHGDNIISGVAHLIYKNCLLPLQRLDIQYPATCRPIKDKDGTLQLRPSPTITDGFDRDLKALTHLYTVLNVRQERLPALKYLRLALWTKKPNKRGLIAINTLYPRLNTLIIDFVMPTAKVRDAWVNYTRGINSDTFSFSQAQLISDPSKIRPTKKGKEKETAEKQPVPSLEEILQTQAKDSQLTCLELYHWIEDNKYPVFACTELTHYIASDWLPKLQHIIIQAGSDNPFPECLSINSETAMDTTGLLAIVLEKALPIDQLKLLMPEKTGYLAWLTHMATGSFPHLTQLHYRLPDLWSKEAPANHLNRVAQALETIYDAVLNGYLPNLAIFIVEGNIPTQLIERINAIDQAIFTQTTQKTVPSQAEEGETTAV
jgi:hypothetical protein